VKRALYCEHFGFTLTGKPILQGICFSLQKGEYLSIIGPNGSGKSTLLKCLLRLHDSGHAQGEILLYDRPVRDHTQRELARHMAYVPQAGGPIPPFTVAELLTLSRFPHASHKRAMTDSDQKAILYALELTDMQKFARHRLSALSGGERQRAFLAAALAQGTEILLLDEPAAFLDPHHAAALTALLKRLHEHEGKTVVTVTHDLNHPLDAGGQVLVLRHGRQIFNGPATALACPGILETAFEHSFTYILHPGTGRPLVLADHA